ncbi:MAG: hypothetical protein EG822_02820 [Deltaproteobacteria bacterium]|nr:hypothetical protein [Deltaproteobacteria bacterium]TLN00991.1 MAG: hypothetical protein FDZ73_17510 [bacterium]
MNARILLVTIIVALFVLAPVAYAQPAGKHTSVSIPASDPFTDTLIDSLKQGGFRVSQGYAKLYTQQDCYDHTYPVLKNCFGANPAAPYVLPVVQPWPEEYVDPALVNAFVETDPGYSATYRLDEREALVIYGRMPPAGRYMGLQTFEFSEHGQWRPKDYDLWANTPNLSIPLQYLFTTIPPDDPTSRRIITLSSLGDVVNSAVMERQLGGEDPFGQTLYFITTPSDSTDRAVRKALQAQGVADSHIFTEQIPRRDNLGPIGPLGMGKNAIDFFTAFRYAVPADTDAAKTWRENPPLTVLRVRAPDSIGPVQRFGSLAYAPRTANSELDMAGDLQNLVDAVCDSVGSTTNLTGTDCVSPQPASSFLRNLVSDFDWTGPYCRKIGMDCLGDQQEAAYYFSTPLPTGSGEVYAVIAPLATETGNAVYVGLSANDAAILGGVPEGTLLDTQLKGSADVYASTVNNTGKFFVRYFSKDCSVLATVPGAADNCTTISGMSTQGDPALQGMIIISLRNYIAPGTTSGPDASLLLTPRILMFTP